MKRAGVALFLSVFLSCSKVQQVSTTDPDSQQRSPSQVAQAELQNVRTGKEWMLLGVGPPEEATKATLGSPMHVYFAKADELAAYKGGDLRGILHETDDLVFPVLVDGKGRLLIEVGQRGGEWTTIRDGYQDSATSLITCDKTHQYTTPAAEDHCSSKQGRPAASIFVKISSLNESNLLLTGATQTAGPGGSYEAVPVPDLNSVIEVVQLNGKPLVNKDGQAKGVPGTDTNWVLHSGAVYGVSAKELDQGPGAALPNPAQDFFKAMAPAAKQALNSPDHGPA